MRKILFVDDEPMVLQGLKRMLRPLRKEWEMSFVESGNAALDHLEQSPVDVVVSDMRMPVMDGAQLLTEVMKRYPHIVRIILSGHSDKELILRSIGPTHQYLAKPCDAKILQDTITRACALRELLADTRIKDLVTRIKSLPSLPSFYAEIIEEVNKEDCSLQKVGDIISKDVGMAAKILQLVNSAFFGLPRHVSSVAQAVSLLGLDTIKALVVSVQVFSQFEGTEVSRKYIEFLFHHSIAVGSYARLISIEEGVDKKTIDDALLAGILHEVGSLVLAANLPDEYSAVLHSAQEHTITLCEAEKEIIGATHTEVGAYLLGLWGFPNPIVEALAFHHCPTKCLSQVFCPLTAVHVADVLDHEHAVSTIGAVPQFNMQYLEELQSTHRINSWRERCAEINREGVVL